MSLGKIVEMSLTERIAKKSRHPYTQILWSSLVEQHNTEAKDAGKKGGWGVFDFAMTHSGCRFAPRCPVYEAKGRPAICTDPDSEPQLSPKPGPPVLGPKSRVGHRGSKSRVSRVPQTGPPGPGPRSQTADLKSQVPGPLRHAGPRSEAPRSEFRDTEPDLRTLVPGRESQQISGAGCIRDPGPRSQAPGSGARTPSPASRTRAPDPDSQAPILGTWDP